MGRNRLPTEIQDAKGYFLEHPDRYPEGSEALEQAPSITEPPERLTEELKTLWIEIAGQLVPGVLKRSDETMFEALIRLIAKLRDDTIEIGERTQLIKLGSEFGMSPASRPKVNVEQPKKTGLQKFLNKKPC